MSQSEEAKRLSGGPQGQRAAKRPYRKPAARYEQVFETRALSCGKVSATQRECKLQTKTS